ncbi:MAG: aminoacyl-histidine dipeptidase [Alistipes sp.]|nr:aminoacyl-histidine dipeptidase [Alistipes sp.]
MDKNLKALQPAAVWHYFSEIAAIPRPSHHEERIRNYIVNFAAQHNLEHCVDSANNVYIRKPATPGMENRKGIVLQAHLDMVPQKNNDKVFDFENDSIEAYVDGEWVTANGTTLGADNGIGAAAILAVLADETAPHGEIEALFTATEETGMDGAFGLKGGLLKGDILLNLDSETEGELYVGCAGGLDLNAVFDYKAEAAPASGYEAVTFTVKGLKGGHSGIQIGSQRGNANRLLFRFLNAVGQEWLLASVDGGGLRNAIPREAVATLLVKDAAAFAAEAAEYERTITAEFAGIEDSISVTVAPADSMPAEVIPADTAKRITKAVIGVADGVARMSVAMEGLVQTSTNLARVVSDGSTVRMQCLLRSSMNSEKQALAESMSAVFELAGAEVELSGAYDGWNPDMASPVLYAMRESYKALFGKDPAVTAIHAGLECGIIGGTYPNLDMISFGPTICYPHSPDEKVEIASVGKFYSFLLDTLKNAPRK